MKKYLLLLCVYILSANCYGQTSFFSNLKKALHEKYPEMELENKLIAINFFNDSDPVRQNDNQQFENALSIFHAGKLAGGPDGLIVVLIDRNNPDTSDLLPRIGKSVTLKKSALKPALAANINNITYDMYGREIYRNLPETKIFESIQKLITR